MHRVALLVFVFLPDERAAAVPADEAREANRRAMAAYNLGHFDEAAREYETAYKLVQDPALLYNVGQSHRQANNPEKALHAYRAYLRTAPADAGRRALAEQRVRELELVVSRLRASGAAAGTVPTAPPPVVSVPAPAPVPPAAAPAVRPSSDPTPPSAPPPLPSAIATDPLPAAAAEPTPSAPLLSAHETASPAPSTTPVYQRGWFWGVVGGAGAAAVIVGVLVGLDRRNPDCRDLSPCGTVK